MVTTKFQDVIIATKEFNRFIILFIIIISLVIAKVYAGIGKLLDLDFLQFFLAIIL